MLIKLYITIMNSVPQKIDEYEQRALYSFENEHDACGVGLVLNIFGEKSHEIVEKGLQVLENMVHRGAESADNKTGDGAGILVQIPHEFILLQGIAVPAKGRYGTGLVFLPKESAKAQLCINVIKEQVEKEIGHRLDLVAFIVSLIGLSSEKVDASFADFINKYQLTAVQIQFLDTIKLFLTSNGKIDPEKLYDSPFKNYHSLGIDGVFNEEQSMNIFNIIDNFNNLTTGN